MNLEDDRPHRIDPMRCVPRFGSTLLGVASFKNVGMGVHGKTDRGGDPVCEIS